ncbi:MAG: dimethylarginine dimethylaminohydrolase family protein [Pseudohongiellaceae bacterium]
MFTNAIVRTPCRNMISGITTADLGAPDYDLALAQHEAYISALEQCGVSVTILDKEEDYPDSTFVEDTALITPKCAVLTNPGAETRKGEVATIQQALSSFYSDFEKIRAPGTLDAGDVMMTGDHYFIGLSERTNVAGANQLIAILEKHGLSGSTVEMNGILHLKTGLSYLENNNLVIASGFKNEPQFAGFNPIEIDDDESYAANGIWVNERVIVAAGFPKAKAAIEKSGFETIALDMSEFQKLDGGLSCLSLRF